VGGRGRGVVAPIGDDRRVVIVLLLSFVDVAQTATTGPGSSAPVVASDPFSVDGRAGAGTVLQTREQNRTEQNNSGQKRRATARRKRLPKASRGAGAETQRESSG